MGKSNFILHLIFVLSVVFLCVGCSQHKDSVTTIHVAPALVCQTSIYGYVSRGSILFNPSQAVEGYAVHAIKDKIIIETYYCTQKELDRYIKMMGHQVSPSDSISDYYNSLSAGWQKTDKKHY